jgi:hypothetical protein
VDSIRTYKTINFIPSLLLLAKNFQQNIIVR